MNVIAEIIVGIIIIGGVIVSNIASIGLIRLPDVYSRSHASGKAATLSVLTILTGTFLYFLIFEGLFSIRLVLGIFFVFLTAPVASHMIIRAAYRNKVPATETTVKDELKDYLNNPVELEK